MATSNWLHKSRTWISFGVLAPAAVAALFSRLHFGIESWQHLGLDCAGWTLFFAGAGMRWWATLYIGGRKTAQLVMEGPYSICRNPIYLGTFLLTLSVGVFSQSAVFSLAVVVATIVYLGVTVPVEERGLEARHGDRFREYCRRVPKFFPKLRLFHSPETAEVHLRGLWIEFVRACRWMWIPIVCELLLHLRTEPWWPVWQFIVP